ncbi:LysR family transcriptional regulator [Nesterenkonia populi]
MWMVDLTRLRTFRAVLADGSVHGAAAQLGYTPSAVSQQLQALQKEVGLDLLERNGRGLAPTALGRTFADEAERLLQEASRLEKLTQDLRGGRTGSLSVMHISSVGAAWMPGIVATLAREFPQLRLDLHLWELQHGTQARDVEVYIREAGASSSPHHQGDGYESEDLLTEPYVAVLPAAHPLASRREVSLPDLQEETWVDNDLTDGACRRILIDACAASGFIPAFQVETQDHATAVAFVEAGAGITVMPRLSYLSARANPDLVSVVELADPTPVRTIAVRAKKALAHTPPVLRLKVLLRSQAGQSH